LKRFAWRNKTEAIMKSGGKVLLLRGLGCPMGELFTPAL